MKNKAARKRDFVADVNECIDIINGDKPSTANDFCEAMTIFFKELYGVDVKNKNGKYKNIGDVFAEAAKDVGGN